MIVLWIVAVALVAGYYNLPWVERAMRPIFDFQASGGWVAAVVNRVVFCGMLPGVFLIAVKSIRPAHPWATILANCIWMGAWGIASNAFFTLQAHVFGTGHDIGTLVAKVFVDKCIWSAMLCVPLYSLFFYWEGRNFSLSRCRAEWPQSYLRQIYLTLLVSVMGQGVLGQFAVMLLKAAGAAPIIAADPVPEKRERALSLGADYAFDPMSADFAEKVKGVTDTGHKVQNGRTEDSGAKVVIEVTGNGAALDTALDAIAPFGRLALLGCTRDSNFKINYYRKVHGRGVTLVGAHTSARPVGESAAGWWTTRDDALAFLKLLDYGRISLDGFVAEVHKPEECGEVYARLAKGGAFPTIQFDWAWQ